MTGLALTVLLQISTLGAEGLSYDQAFSAAQASGKPIVVLVGADWCPGCRTMKQSTIPGLSRQGKLANVQYATVNTDKQPALAKKLMRGDSIPQLIVYTKSGEGWTREQVVGNQSGAQVSAMIDRAVRASAPKKLASNKPAH